MNKQKQKQIKEIMDKFKMPYYADASFKKLNACDVDLLHFHLMNQGQW